MIKRMVRRIVTEVFFQDERLEKPRCVGQMPFCRADVGHGLDDKIFRLQTGAEVKCSAPRMQIPFKYRLFWFDDGLQGFCSSSEEGVLLLLS